ncbi:MAG: RidA family protein [Albidovulum sp.]|uniref:RidA family protein n=1 Tax=Albidovulum sp. TaxID=1872424 RepID=UPI001320E08A|nr:RidA family protein [Defluviimonas sp.]KAB2886535.1 MAG: RidA family protein [Defluviimonas sp.]
MSAEPRSTGEDRDYRAPEGFLAKAPISNAVRVGDVIYISGQIGIDETGAVVPGGIGGQTRKCLENIREILASYGATLADVAQTRIFLTDFAGYADYNRVYQEFFSAPFPTRSTVGTPALALGAQIEIEAVAFLRRQGR